MNFQKSMKRARFVQLLEAVHEVEGLERLRFHLTAPDRLSRRPNWGISTAAEIGRHLHLPVQSGSDRILKAMHRTYTAEKYVDLVRRVRQAREGIAITTDIIVGFPGETDDDFTQTRKLVKEVEFDNAFVFRYSPRRDTPAAEMADQIDESIKEARNHDLLEVVDDGARTINEQLVGRTLEVLCEGPSRTNRSRLMGRTRTNKIVLFESHEDLTGTLVDVRIERVTGFSLYGDSITSEVRAQRSRHDLRL